MTFDGGRVRAVGSNSQLFVRASSRLNRDAATKLKAAAKPMRTSPGGAQESTARASRSTVRGCRITSKWPSVGADSPGLRSGLSRRWWWAYLVGALRVIRILDGHGGELVCPLLLLQVRDGRGVIRRLLGRIGQGEDQGGSTSAAAPPQPLEQQGKRPKGHGACLDDYILPV
jgi:hypothetical protein